MAIEIYIRRGKQFLCSKGKLSSQMDEALVFRTAKDAESFCQQKHMNGVELFILRGTKPPATVPISRTRSQLVTADEEAG
jgi:hypothetical protein